MDAAAVPTVAVTAAAALLPCLVNCDYYYLICMWEMKRQS